MQPPPRKQSNYLKGCKNLHTEQYSKLQAKNQQECDLLEDIRNFTKQRSAIEKSYGEALCKIAINYQNRKIACVPDIRLEDGSEAWNIYSVWRTVLDETEKLGKTRLAAVEIFHQRISEDAKHTRHSKINLGRKLTDNLQVIQKEVQLQVQELDRHRRCYYTEENVAHDAREKATDAETKLKRKKGSLFQSISSLQKNSAKFTAKKEQSDEKSAGARNDYLLALSTSNAHQKRYYEIDFERILRTMEADMYDKVSEYLSLMSRTELLTCSATQNSFTKIKEQALTITRGYNLRCYLTFYPMLGHSIEYDFERCKNDQIDKIIAYDDVIKETLNSEGRKFAKRVRKEHKIVREASKKIKNLQTGHRNDAGEFHPDVEIKLDDLRQVIRRAETNRVKIEAKLQLLREGGIEIEDYTQKTADTDSLGTEIDTPLSRSGSTLSVKEENTTSADAEEEVTREAENKQHSVESVEAEREYEYQEQQKSLDATNWDPTSVDWGDAPVSPLPPVANGPQDEPAYPKCIVLYNYDAQNPDELTIVENDELEIISEGDGDGWVQARNYKGEVGYIPQNYIEMEEASAVPGTVTEEGLQTIQQSEPVQSANYEEYQNGQSDYDQQGGDFSSAPPADLPPPPPIVAEEEVERSQLPHLAINKVTNQNLGSYCFAMYDYEATCPEELTFEEGAVIRLVSKTIHDIDDGWWEGSFEGVHGLFPSLVVEECRHDGQPFTPDAESLSSPCTTPPPHTPPEVPGFLLPPEKVIITQPTPEVETVEEAIALQKAKKGEAQNGTQPGEQHQHYHRQFSSSPDSEATTERDQQYGELVSSPDVSNQEPSGRECDIFNGKDNNSLPTTPDPVEDPKPEAKTGTVTKPPVTVTIVTADVPSTDTKKESSNNVALGAAQIIVTAATPMVEVEEPSIPLQEDSRVEADQQQEEDSHADSEDIDGEANFLEDDRPPPPPPAPEGGTASRMMKQEDSSFKEPPAEVEPEPAKMLTSKASETDTLDSNVPPPPKSPSPSDGPPDLDPEKLKSLDKIKESIA